MKALICLVAGAALVSGCAIQPQNAVSKDELKSRADDAMRLQAMCSARTMPDVDDGISDAQSVALALSLRCSREYQQATEAFALANLDNDAQRRMFRERRGRAQEKIEAFLPFVMDYRTSNRRPSR